MIPYIGELSALFTSFLWSGASFAFTSAAQRIGSIQLNVNRIILASIFLFVIISLAGYSYDLSFDQIKYLVLSGIVGLVFGDSFLFKSFQLIGARLGMLVMALVPAMSSILALIFLNEILSILAVTGIVITLTGIGVVILDRNQGAAVKTKINYPGVFYGVLGALGQAGGLILAKFAFEINSINGFVASFVRLFSSALIIFPVVVLIKKYKNPFRLYKNDVKAFTTTIAGTIFGPVLGITFSLIAIEFTKIGVASTLMSLMPIIMLPVARYYYKEIITWRAIIGAIIAVAGTAIIFLR